MNTLAQRAGYVLRYDSGDGRLGVSGRWTPEETRLLLAMRQEQVTRDAIARILQRSFRSVKKRLERV